MQKKAILALVALAAVIGVGVMVVEGILYASTDNAQIGAHSVLLAPKVSGFVTQVNVDDGARVRVGDVMVEIDPRDFENAVAQSKGQLMSLEAQLADAQRNKVRQTDLYAKKVAPQQQYDAAVALEADLNARVQAAAAGLKQAELNLSNTKLSAPAEGFVAKKSAEVGQFASAGVPLIGFVDAQERWVMANFKETELKGIAVGAKAFITVDAIPGKEFKGEVESLSAATGSTFTLLPPDNASGNFTKVVQRVPVKIRFIGVSATELETLRAGMSVVVKIRKGSAH